MRYMLTSLLILGCSGVMMAAELKTKVVEYEYQGTKLKGFMVYENVDAKRPGVLIVHEWWGLNDYAKMRAEMLAKLGYVAFCVDMYGDGKTTEHPKEAGEFAGKVRENLEVWRGRAEAGLKTFQAQPQVDATKIAAIGYCFGGSTALQLAYTGADLKAVGTFHAALPIPTEAEAKAIKCPLMICHGADDSFIPEQVINSFKGKVTDAKVKLDFIAYPGAKHSFTVKGVDAKGVNGLAYNADADEKSWKSLQELLKTTLK
ncbi:MAG: dienelactone hydrolase family protein [Zavarzinella sp.]